MKSELLPPHRSFESPPQLVAARACIVCGTDLSDWAGQAVEVAGALAKNLREPLVLTHAVDEKPHEQLPDELRESLSLYARSQLHAERERIREMEVELVEAFRSGKPGAVLLEESAARRARLLVLTSTKRNSLDRLLHGDVIDKVTQSNQVPTLIVRDPKPLLRWIRGERKLRIFVGADFSAPSDAALRWVNWARRIGPCQIVVACLEPTPAIHPSLDPCPSPLMDDFAVKIGCMQERYFKQRIRTLVPDMRLRVRFEPNWGRSDAHLIHMALEERADLIVIGTRAHRPRPFAGHDSTCRGIVRYAPLNVVCVPTQAHEESEIISENSPSIPRKIEL
jgi:nucleotide-binding universal stress UspA family protein